MLSRRISLRLGTFVREMASLSFIQHLNPITNKTEWKVVSDEYDYNREIATSCYGDMLHDEERNKKFGEALKKAIDKLHRCGKKAHVLDIGTGTGLLSMLAARYGADSVVACEAFLPMANCALNILEENNFSDRIRVIKAHSTSLTVGEDGDLKQKPNILVSEVFDTELIGEGAIQTFNHAFEHLLEVMPPGVCDLPPKSCTHPVVLFQEECIVIPSSGTVYAQVVESDLAQKWNRLEDWKQGEEVVIRIPNEMKECPGVGAVHDIQLSEFDRRHFRVLSQAMPVFRFDWAKNKKIPRERQNKSVMRALLSGKAQVVFMWWDLKMDEEGDIVISCAPVWEHPDTKDKFAESNRKNLAKSLPWRDHWMQAVYFFRTETPLAENDSFTLVSNHDEFSFWFDIERPGKALEASRPVCECASHFLLSRTRIGAINDDLRRQRYLQTLRTFAPGRVCVVLNDISLLGPLCAKLGAKQVYVLSESASVKTVYDRLSEANGLTMCVVSSIDQIADSIRGAPPGDPYDVLILSEPHFRNSILPWDNLAFWYMKEELVRLIKDSKMVKSVRTCPKKCALRCCAVRFDNLWKIATPLSSCEGFSMRIFDNLIASAKDKAQSYVEPQPLWEYPGIALTEAATIFEFELDEEMPKERTNRKGALKFGCGGRCDGVALWMEYQLTEECRLNFGPVRDVVVDEYITWDMGERQGVHLFRKGREMAAGDVIHYEAEFDPQEGEFHFSFGVAGNPSRENGDDQFLKSTV